MNITSPILTGAFSAAELPGDSVTSLLKMVGAGTGLFDDSVDGGLGMVMSALAGIAAALAVAMLLSIEDALPRLMRGWLIVALLASALRVVTSPRGLAADVGTLAPYVLLISAPLLSMMLALRWFADGDAQPQPSTRIARAGTWRTVSPTVARRHRYYGASGFMLSLMVGRSTRISAAVPS